MITHENLIRIGFKDIGWINNRHYYELNNFNIVEHNDYYINYDLYPYHKVKTIEDILIYIIKIAEFTFNLIYKDKNEEFVNDKKN